MQGLRAVGLHRAITCMVCSPHAPLSTCNDGGDSVHFLHTVDAHGMPVHTLEASLRGYLAEGFIEFKHGCQSLHCARTTTFKEVPPQLHLVIQRASAVSQPRPAHAMSMCHVLHHTQLACMG